MPANGASDITAKDERDSNRDVAPLVPAPGAAIIDSTDMDIEMVVAEAYKIVKEKLPNI